MTDVKKRSVTLNGHRTSYSIEDEFYTLLLEMASQQYIALARLIASIDETRAPTTNLSSALRLAVLRHTQNLPA
jgi:predicted DNA-binding ribbon-helix-helix protein